MPNHIREFAKQVKSSSNNTAESYLRLLHWLADTIADIDEDVTDLAMQREKLRRFFDQYEYQANAFFADEITEDDVPEVPTRNRVTRFDDQTRVLVLKVADELGEPVAPEEIREALEAKGRNLVWKNPNAVIATILSRSNEWEKGEDGRWNKKPASQFTQI